MNAKEVFETIAMHAEKLAPPARGAAIAASLRQVGAMSADLPLDFLDAHVGFDVLSRPTQADTARDAARRRTCRELAFIAASYDASSGDVSKLAAVLARIVERFTNSKDPREDAMAWTAAREVEELRQAAERGPIAV